jgi:DNA repair protein RadA/Sms
MSKSAKTMFECNACGTQSPKWLGRCTNCGGWNSLIEMPQRRGASAGHSTGAARAVPQPIGDISALEAKRFSTGLSELDRALGGGPVAGGVILLGGEPGIGKSTLLMQALAGLVRGGAKALYVTGEESASQVAMRAQRIGIGPTLMLLATTELADIVSAMDAARFDVVVIDSIQTMRESELEAGAGSVAQLREVTAKLTDIAKRRDIAMFLIGHVTKDGGLAGPKVLEHLVDAVLSFEGDSTHALRIVRAAKNRFGPAQEVGVFEMTADGLREVKDPGSLFIEERPKHATGSVVVPTAQGSRPLLVEVQALVAPAQYGAPRRVATGLDANRLAVLLAVLARKAGVHVLDQDVFASVAGGVRVDEPAVDLALCIAVVSSLRERPAQPESVFFGEVGLAGELRAVSRAASRAQEARKLGFRRIVMSAANAERLTASERKGLDIVGVPTLDAALGEAF